MNDWYRTGRVALLSVLLSACGQGKTSVGHVALTALTIDANRTTLETHSTLQLAAHAKDPKGVLQDVTTSAAWSSSDPNVADVDGEPLGLLRAKARGTTTVTATVKGIKVTKAFEVVDVASLTINPTSAVFLKSTQQVFAAVVTLTDGSQRDVTDAVEWAASDPSVARLATSPAGAFLGVQAGACLVTAKYSDTQASAAVTVLNSPITTVDLTPLAATVLAGTQMQIVATSLFADNTRQDVTGAAAWQSSDPQIATVSAGSVVGIAGGTVTITASYGGLTGYARLNVTAASVSHVSIAPHGGTIALHTSLPLSASVLLSDGTSPSLGGQVGWSAADPTIVTVDAATGLAFGQGVGCTDVTALYAGVSEVVNICVSGNLLTALQVTPRLPMLAMGTAISLQAAGVFSDGSVQDLTAQVLWQAADPMVAISGAGVLTGLAAGSTVVTATLDGLSAQADVIVTAAQLLRLEVTPPTLAMANGTQTALKATGIFSDGTVQDLSSQATWRSGDPQVAAVASVGPAAGSVLAQGHGTAVLTVSFGGASVDVLVVVSDATLSALAITPSVGQFAVGVQTNFVAVATFSDGTTQDVTPYATWTSSHPLLFWVSSTAPSPGQGLALGAGSTTVGASFGGKNAASSITVGVATLQSVRVAARSNQMPRGMQQRLAAYGTFSDHTVVDLTQQVAWTVTDANFTVGVVPPTQGLLTALGTGTATVQASLAGIRDSVSITASSATLATLVVNAGAGPIAVGGTRQLTATGIFSDGTQFDMTRDVAWSSGNGAVAGVANTFEAVGLATGLASGTTTVTATRGGISATASLIVADGTLARIDITPAPAVLPLGTQKNLSAFGVFTGGAVVDLTALAFWDSANHGVASVESVTQGAQLPGRVTSRGAGSTSVTATWGGLTGTALVSITGAQATALALNPAGLTLSLGTQQQAHVFAFFSDGTSQDVTGQAWWTVTDANIAVVSSVPGSAGIVTASQVRVGSTTLTASFASLSVSGIATVTSAALNALEIIPGALTLAAGTRAQLAASGSYSDATHQDLSAQVAWSSSSPGVVAVSNTGTLSAVAPGTAFITVDFAGVPAFASVTVTAATLAGLEIVPAVATLPNGTRRALAALGHFSDGTSQDLTGQAGWSASDPTVLAVSNAAGSQGVVTALKSGVTHVTATAGSTQAGADITVGGATLAALHITPASGRAPVGVKQPLFATAVYSDGAVVDVTSQVAWTTSAPTVASVSNLGANSGEVYGVSPGVATIFAGFAGASASATVTVTGASLVGIAVSPSAVLLPLGLAQRFVAMGTFSDGTAQDISDTVVWDVQDGTLANVTATGTVTGLAVGTTAVVATLAGTSGSATLTVGTAHVQSIDVTPLGATVARGLTKQFAALGHFSDGSVRTLTDQVAWSTGDRSIAVLASVVRPGLIAGLAAGSTTVSATFGIVTSAATIAVSPAALTSLSVSPAIGSLSAGLQRAYVATGTFSDGSQQDLTTQVAWTTDNDQIAVVANAVGSQGTVQALSAGSTGVRATLGSITSAAALTVTTATLSAIILTPYQAALARGLSLQMAAIGIFSDGSALDVTAQVSWRVVDASIASVTGNGLLTGVTVGTTQLSTTLAGIVGSVPVTITASSVATLTVSPPSATLAVGTTRTFAAIATMSDGSVQDMTSQVLWTSALPGIAWVDNTSGSVGRVGAQQQGSTAITATLGNVSSSAPVTVSAAVPVGLDIAPITLTLAQGTQTQLQATGRFSDGTAQDLTGTVTWSTGNAVVAQVNAGSGLLSALSIGTTTATATWGGRVATSLVSVSAATLTALSISPAPIQLALGTRTALHAVGTFSDGTAQDLTAQVTWGVSDGNILVLADAVASPGVIVARGQGSATLTAVIGASGGPQGAAASVTVSAATLTALQIDPPQPTVASGLGLQLSAVGVFSDGTRQDLTGQVLWRSQDASVAQIVVNSGWATGVAPGSVTLVATFGAATATATLRVTAGTLTSVSIAPASLSVALGTTTALRATGVFSDASAQDVTSQVVWTSDNPNVAAVANAQGTSGLVSTLATGTAHVSATLAGKSSVVTVQVTSATLVTLVIAPASSVLSQGQGAFLHAQGIYSDSSVQDVTTQVTWASSDSTIATISNALGSRGYIYGVSIGSATLGATMAGVVATASVSVTSAVTVSLALSPSLPTAAAGTTVAFAASALLSDNSRRDVSTLATWVSSDPNVAQVSPQSGLATAVAPGTTSITAGWDGQTSTTLLTVTAAALQRISMAPTTLTLAAGTDAQLTATGIFADGTTQDITAQVAWLCADANIAAVSTALGSAGRVTALASGTSTVTATLGSTWASIPLQVTAAVLTGLAVSPATASLAAGTAVQLGVVGTFSDGSTQDVTQSAAWSSNNVAASVSNTAGSQGHVTANSQGTATVTASLAGLNASAVLTVTAATLSTISLAPSQPTLTAGQHQTLQALGTFSDGSTQDLSAAVTWTSSSANVATVSNAAGSYGLVTAASAGGTTVGAALGTVVGSTTVTVTAATLTSITVSPASNQIVTNTTLQLSAVGLYSDSSSHDITSQVAWTSADPATATVQATGSPGLVTGIYAGSGAASTVITAILLGKSSTADVTVRNVALQSIAVTPATASLANGLTQQFIATGTFTDASTQDITAVATWSTDSNKATVSASGLATGVAQGTAHIIATRNSLTAQATLTVSVPVIDSVAVSPASVSLAKGRTQQLSAAAVYSDDSNQDVTGVATWTSSDPNVATVTVAGLVTAVTVGSATITATDGGKAGTTAVSVTAAVLDSIALSPTAIGCAMGRSIQFTATGTYSDSSTQDLTNGVSWQSSQSAVATVSSAGVASCATLGSTTVSATLTGKVGATTLTVTAAELEQLGVTPGATNLAAGLVLQYVATGVYSDGSVVDVSATAGWASSAPSIATVNSAGVASGVSAGTATVSATLASITATSSLHITSATLSGIGVTPVTPSLSAGLTRQFSAVGTFSDGSTQDLTSQVTWTSSATSKATITSQGVATGVAAGTTTVSAALLSKSGSTTLTVTSATLSSITLTPAIASMALGTKVQFTATGVFSDGSAQDLTGQCTWSSSSTSILTVSSVAGSRGLTTGVALGTATLSATLNSVVGSLSIAITPATLSAIEIGPTDPSAAKGTTQAFTATGIFSDSSRQDLTIQAVWSVVDANVASVSNATGSHGSATAINTGTTLVRATSNGVSATTSLTVTPATLVSLAVTPDDISLAAGFTQQFTATGSFSDATTQDVTSQVTWATSSATFATVSNAAGSHGFVTAVSPGSATITASLSGITDTTPLTVTNATLTSIGAIPGAPTMAKGTQLQLVATGTFSDSTSRDITAQAVWTSSNTAAVSVSNASGSQGLATAMGVGSSTVTVTLDGQTDTSSITVTAATLSSIAVAPTTATFPKGTKQAYTAIGTFTDASTQDITTQVVWQSTNTAVATVSNTAGSQGSVTAVAAGTSTIRATASGITGTATATVTSAVLQSIAVTPVNSKLPAKFSKQLTATGTYTDGTTQDLTTQVTWSSSKTTWATVSNTAGAQGKATGVAAGTVTITATRSGISGTTTLIVTSATVSSITLAPASFTVAVKGTLQLTATATFSDGTTMDITTQATWSSSRNRTATVTSKGLVTGVKAGTVNITATKSGKSKSAACTVQ